MPHLSRCMPILMAIAAICRSVLMRGKIYVGGCLVKDPVTAAGFGCIKGEYIWTHVTLNSCIQSRAILYELTQQIEIHAARI